MAKLFQVIVPNEDLISRIINSGNQVHELMVIERADKKFVADHSKELEKPALYILVNRDTKKLYVGETDDSIKRLRNHSTKEFWTEAIVFHSTTETLSTTEVKWLEAKAYKTIAELGFYDLSENIQTPQFPKLKKYQELDLEPIFQEAKGYICAAGFDFFLKSKDIQEQAPEVPNQVGNIWLICYDSNYFNVAECFKKYGQVYWRHKAGIQNIREGDIVYLYGSSPESAIRFKAEVVESQLPYSKEMDAEDEFLISGSSNSDDSKSKFFLVRYIAETYSSALKHSTMQKAGLMGKRPSATKLSKVEYKALREYIEQNFDDTTPVESIAHQKKLEPKKQEKPKAKTERRSPFKFSMIGLKPGDTIIFAPNGEKVRVNSENTVDYDGQILTLSRFCKIYMPDENSELKEYQGPAHFTYKGKTLDEIRKEKEK